MIKAAIRLQDNMVLVFDKKGEQILRYQGRYQAVKQSVLGDAPPDAQFAHGLTDAGELREVPREEW